MASAAVISPFSTEKTRHTKKPSNSSTLSSSPPYRTTQSPLSAATQQQANLPLSASPERTSISGMSTRSRSPPLPAKLSIDVDREPVGNGSATRPSNAVNDSTRFGQPPPSPPASIKEEEDSPIHPMLTTTRSEPYVTTLSTVQQPLVFDEPESANDFDIVMSSAPLPPPKSPAGARSATMVVGAIVGANKDSFESQQRADGGIPSDILSPSISHVDAQKPTGSSDFLQPPPMSMHNARPTRRNTTGSNFAARLGAGPGARASMHAHFGSQPGASAVFGEDMASDIQHQADKIRKERQEKRAKQKAEAEAEAALERRGRDEPVKGNIIGENHRNYELMYNMLTGIRVGVSRCQAKIKRPLTDDDFKSRHKFSFDFVGNELTPSAKYDFKFKDYAPWVFRSLREDYFHLDPADYLMSLTEKYILSELGSPGKSGSFFYFSRDYKYIIKTIHHSEHKFLLSVLKDYYNHVKENPHTLISRFYGLHRVRLPRGRKIHFVIMNNLFPPHKDIHDTYDLKGSTVGRESPPDAGVKKDLNWINSGKQLDLGPEKRALLTEQLRRDKELLKKIHVMDYSLLVGIHNMRRGNRDNVRANTLKIFEPHFGKRHTSGSSAGTHKPSSKAKTAAMRQAMRVSDPKQLQSLLPDTFDELENRQQYIFYQDEGGMRATDENNEELDTLYYLGVIDILTPYSKLKKAEHIWKSMQADKHKISPVPPEEYSDRFFDFMKAVMRGGGGGDRFK